jgi:hypothetical protein
MASKVYKWQKLESEGQIFLQLQRFKLTIYRPPKSIAFGGNLLYHKAL